MAIAEGKSHVRRVNKKSESLKTTIPPEVIQKLDIREGDRLKWSVVLEDKKPIVKLRRVHLIESD